MAGGASRTARLQYLSAPESGGRQPHTRHDVNDPLLLAHQKQRTSNPPLSAGLFAAAANSWPQGRRNVADCTQKASRCTQPVGGTATGWLAGDAEKLASQYSRPGEPAIANRLALSRNAPPRVPPTRLMQRTESQRGHGRPQKFARDRSADDATVGFRDCRNVNCALLPQQQGKMHEKVRSREKKGGTTTTTWRPLPPLVTVRAGT